MIVQPASLDPRGRPRRALRMIALVVPVLLLGGVVAAGVLGPSPAPTRAPASAPAIADATPSPADESASPPVGPSAPVFPSTIAGLDVHGVHWMLEARNRGLARGVVAVAGYLGLDEIPDSCRDSRLGIFGPFCRRVGVLAETP